MKVKIEFVKMSIVQIIGCLAVADIRTVVLLLLLQVLISMQ
jgi:hypothetical protein